MKVVYYKCKICGKVVNKNRRKHHLIKEHRIKNNNGHFINELFTFHHYEIFHSLRYYSKIPIEVLDMEV
jgi:hypothetical protein